MRFSNDVALMDDADWSVSPPSEIEDMEHTIIKCSSCQKDLVDIWKVRDSGSETFSIVANCGHCNDKSFKTEIVGAFNNFKFGHTEHTVMSDIAIEGNNVIIETKPI